MSPQNPQPVTLDMSTAAPLAPAQSGAVQLDMSTLQPIAGVPQPATISAVHEPTTFIGKFGQWAENVANDIKYGTDETGIGTVLKKMGAHGVYNGNSEAVGDFMASLPLGLLKVGKGTSEVAPEVIGGPKGKTIQGLEDIVGGGLQAATIPASFVAPEAAEGAAELGTAATEKAGQVISTALHPKAAAGDILGEVMKAIGDHPVVADDAAEVATKILDKEATGGSLGKVKKPLQKFLDRATDPNDPLTWQEAREFYQNLSKLSPAQKMSLGAGVKPLLRDLTMSLRGAIEDTADAAGVGDRFRQGMRAYRLASGYQSMATGVKEAATSELVKAAATAAGGAAAYKIIDSAISSK